MHAAAVNNVTAIDKYNIAVLSQNTRPIVHIVIKAVSKILCVEVLRTVPFCTEEEQNDLD